MEYIAMKNNHKKEDKHPDYRLHRKDDGGEMIQEEYTNRDGEKKMAWKSFGAIWINRDEEGNVKSLYVQTDDGKSLDDEFPNPKDLPGKDI